MGKPNQTLTSIRSRFVTSTTVRDLTTQHIPADIHTSSDLSSVMEVKTTCTREFMSDLTDDAVNDHPLFGDKEMPNPRLVVLGEPTDFTEGEFNLLAELITKKLRDKGITPKGYDFQIRVEYKPEPE
jgi:hypothetical protein